MGRSSSYPTLSSCSGATSHQPRGTQALAGSRRSSSVSVGSANREPEYADGPAEYNFEYKVADDEQQNYIARQESRDGDTVTGSYNYVNPAGTLVTVNYEAGPDGFKQETSEQKGAVEMRNVPVGWDGPLAGVDDAGSVSSGVSASSPPLDKPALSGLLLVRSPLTVLPLLFRQLAMDPACPVLVRTASPGQGAAPLTRATLSAL